MNLLNFKFYIVFSSLIFTDITINKAYGDSHALLIGVSNYPLLSDNKQLKGPENDVRLLKKVLLSYQFDVNNITTLTTSGKENLQPKRHIILSKLHQLVNKAKPKDKILLYFSGHGSQQPNPKESDGYDEIFLPTDIGFWNDSKKQVKNV